MQRSSDSTIANLGEQVLTGNRRAVARAMTLVERGGDSAEKLISQLYPKTGNAHIVGITGPPGAGKSSLVNALTKQLRAAQQTVGIIAVDPSSPFTGGALLGDRIRMNDLYGDKGIFIRSMATRGQLGGLAQTTHDLVKVLDAGGFDVVLVETVGAGQAEVDIVKLAHTTVVVEAPGLGDDVQSIKAGILESADILVVNKADRQGSQNTVRALRNMLQLGQGTTARHHGVRLEVTASEQATSVWQVPLHETVATDGQGVAQLAAAVEKHKDFLQLGSGWLDAEKRRSQAEIEGLLLRRLLARWQRLVSAESRAKMIHSVATRQRTPYEATQLILADAVGG